MVNKNFLKIFLCILYMVIMLPIFLLGIILVSISFTMSGGGFAPNITLGAKLISLLVLLLPIPGIYYLNEWRISSAKKDMYISFGILLFILIFILF